MANKDNKSYEQPYIKVGGKKIAATEAQARAHMRSRWAEHKREEREQKCLDEKGHRCTKDCSLCDNERESAVVSLESLYVTGYEPADSFDLEEFAAERILLKELSKALQELDPENRMIAEMVGEGFSEREIGAEVGLSQKGVNKRKNKIFGLLRKKLERFR